MGCSWRRAGEVTIRLLDARGTDLDTGAGRKIETLMVREDTRKAPADEIGKVTYPSKVLDFYRTGFLERVDAAAVRRRCQDMAVNTAPDPQRLSRTAAEVGQAQEQLGTMVKAIKADLGADSRPRQAGNAHLGRTGGGVGGPAGRIPYRCRGRRARQRRPGSGRQVEQGGLALITFGTDGWRGILAADFTFQNVRAVARAVAAYLKRAEPGKDCLIGYDNRFLAPEMARAAWAVLQEEGIGAVLTDRPTPTPVLAYAVQHRGAGGAIMFTASHNPSTYQGMKFIPSYAGPATPEITRELQSTANQVAAQERADARQPADVPAFDPAPAYWAHLDTLVDLPGLQGSGLVFAYDAMHGVGAEYMARLQPQVFLHRERDPLFGGLTPEPTGDGLRPLVAAMQASGAALGLANDGDADRFGCVDPDWGFLNANQVLTLLLWYLTEVKGRRGLVVRTLATTHLLDRIAQRHGCGTMETPVGFKYLGQAMLKHDVLLAGEESGGLSIGGHIPEKDGILACLLLAQIRAEAGKPLSDVLVDIYDRYGATATQRVDVHLHPGDRERIEATLQKDDFPKKFGGRWVVSVDKRDGYKFLLEQGAWTLLRFSGTEPMVRVYGEAESPDGLKDVLQDALAEVHRP